ncbi:MAG: hypothetical protein BroJett040_15510 [Oligoflexia bacterium]|nr:MAG: hypothetical protein BroJett040_15510 [Oligoflexia bacterium]
MIRKELGFTMLELLIALTILATLTVFSSQTIQQAIRSKAKIQEQIDDMSQVRDALRIIEKDVNLAFHYRDLEAELFEAVKKSSQTTSTPPSGTPPPGSPPGTPPPPAGPPTTQPISASIQKMEASLKSPNRVDPTTHFVGTENEMSFITMNTARIQEDESMADFVKVGYLIGSCKRPGAEGQGSDCLLRRLSPIAEGDVTKGGENTLLLENIAEFKLQYIGKGLQDWVSSWNSKTGDGATKGNFPSAVKVSVTVRKGDKDSKKKISMEMVIPVRFTNNVTPTPGASASVTP